MLLCERLGELRSGQEATGDEYLAETAAFFALRCQRAFQLRLRQELQIDEDLAEWAPGLLRRGRQVSR